MKKLFLTSFEFKGIDKNTYKEQRLVMVQSNEVSEGKDHESVAYSKVQKWFHANYNENCELLSIIAHPTITGYAEETQIKNMEHGQIGFDASWNGIDVFPPRVIGFFDGKDYPENYTDNVLIDLDGNRKHFDTGWYDYDTKDWHTVGKEKVKPTMKWQLLPLAKYDKK